MSQTEPKFLPYSKLRMHSHGGIFRQNEIPVGHIISLPLPTLRFGVPGYILFAAPALRSPGEATRQFPPDRWWVLDAGNAHVLVYAQTKSLPMSGGAIFEEIEIPPSSQTIREMKAELEQIEKLMDQVAPIFFTGKQVESSVNDQLRQHLNGALPRQIQGIYQSMAPDFYQWLTQPAKG